MNCNKQQTRTTWYIVGCEIERLLPLYQALQAACDVFSLFHPSGRVVQVGESRSPLRGSAIRSLLIK